MLVDEEGLTAAAFGFNAVPNGVLVDARGIVRFAKYGGFSIDNEEDRDAVERFSADAMSSTVVPVDARGAAPMSGEASDRLRAGRRLYATGRIAEAVALWREALAADPENFIIRKQIWLAEHPERFHPEIDMEWQSEQLALERAAERATAT